MTSSFVGISSGLTLIDDHVQQIAISRKSAPDVSELAFAVHNLLGCVEALTSQVASLRVELASLESASGGPKEEIRA